MAIDVKRVVGLVARLEDVVAQLEALPQILPLAREILAPVFSGSSSDVSRPHKASRSPQRMASGGSPLSDARRKQLSLQAKRRWRAAKKAGKNTIGGAE